MAHSANDFTTISTKNKEDAVAKNPLHRIEPPRESLRHIKKDKVKRVTALFESGDADNSAEIKQVYPYRPKTDLANKLGNTPSRDGSPMLDQSQSVLLPRGAKYKPAVSTANPLPDGNIKPEYPYRPKSLLVDELRDKVDAKATNVSEESSTLIPVYAKVDKGKPPLSDKRNLLISSKAKCFKSTEDEKSTKKSPKRATGLPHDVDKTPTNENINIPKPDAGTPGKLKSELLHNLEKGIKINVPNAKPRESVCNPQPNALPRPPVKPPRTFAHDEYMKAKEVQRQRSTEPTSLDHMDEESHPFYEEVKQDGTIRRKRQVQSHGNKPFEKTASFDTVNDEFKGKLRTYESIKQKTQTYESISDFSLRDSSTYDPGSSQTSKPPTGARHTMKPKPPPKPISQHRSQNTAALLDDDMYHSQSKVQVFRANNEMPRKVKPGIVRRGIANPSYHCSKRHDCIPIKTVPGNDGSLKRYKSDEFLYAEPDVTPLNVSYQDPVDLYPRAAASQHVQLDGHGYAEPFNAVTRLQVGLQCHCRCDQCSCFVKPNADWYSCLMLISLPEIAFTIHVHVHVMHTTRTLYM